jgi:hypothetical protein
MDSAISQLGDTAKAHWIGLLSIANAKHSDGSVLIFRGKDNKGRMAILRLSNPKPNAKKSDELKISLTLSYIEKPFKPDTFQLKENDF